LKSERMALWFSSAMALLMGSVGITFAVLTDSRAILLDGLFNLTYFVVALATIRVAALTARPGSAEFPFGYSYFESLMNAGKGLLILGVSALALLDSLMALATGGREIVAGLAIGYAAFATVVCSLAALWLRRAHRHQSTPLVRADYENWLVNTLISASVLVAFCLIPIVRGMGWEHLTPYVDPVVVTAVVLISAGIPIRMAWRAIMELLDRSPPWQVTAPVHEAVRHTLAQHLPVENVYVRIVQPGRTMFVTIHVVLPADYPVGTLGTLDAVREAVDMRLKAIHPWSITDVMFTSEERWAQPASSVEEIV